MVQLKFVIVLLISTFLMASSFIVGKILMNAGFTPFALVGWRFLVAAVATLPILMFEKDKTFLQSIIPTQVNKKHIFHFIIIGLLQTTGVIGLVFWAMESISANLVSILLYTNPLWVSILGFFLLGEKLKSKQVFGLLLGLVGVILVISIKTPEESAYSVPGMIMGICSALCWAFATIINKKSSGPYSHWTLSFWQMFIGAMFLLIISYLRGEHSTGTLSFSNMAWFLWLAIPGSTISLGLWFKALTMSGVTKASGFLFLCPAFTILISYCFLGVNISNMQLLGGGFIAVSLLLISQNGRNKQSFQTRLIRISIFKR